MNKSFQRLGNWLIMASLIMAPAWGGAVEVSIEKMSFQPEVVKIHRGDTVNWVNHEKHSNHSVLFEKESLESERLFPGESWARTFDKPGSYPYTCGPHPEMTGTVEVTE
ncbi:MAG: cupredoxin domain-containing protein [Sulfuricella sp.]|nr:cupredoxin domain-containing protein [Sulfuricella sp.]